MGASARIGSASDFVFAFVPHGPKKQLDLFFHAMKCYQGGLLEVRAKTTGEHSYKHVFTSWPSLDVLMQQLTCKLPKCIDSANRSSKKR